MCASGRIHVTAPAKIQRNAVDFSAVIVDLCSVILLTSSRKCLCTGHYYDYIYLMEGAD